MYMYMYHHEERKIPRNDLSHDADRFPLNVTEGTLGDRAAWVGDESGDLIGVTRVVAIRLKRETHVNVSRLP